MSSVGIARTGGSTSSAIVAAGASAHFGALRPHLCLTKLAYEPLPRPAPDRGRAPAAVDQYGGVLRPPDPAGGPAVDLRERSVADDCRPAAARGALWTP